MLSYKIPGVCGLVCGGGVCVCVCTGVFVELPTTRSVSPPRTEVRPCGHKHKRGYECDGIICARFGAALRDKEQTFNHMSKICAAQMCVGHILKNAMKVLHILFAKLQIIPEETIKGDILPSSGYELVCSLSYK